jgi:gliding motility-associated-like protein
MCIRDSVYTHIITLTIEKGYSLVVPNAFTPNKDGLNEYFTPVFIGLSDMRLDIYDTWGSLIYSETGDDLQGWNGMIKETEAENGNYYYKFSAKTFYGELKIEEGAFVLIK